MTAPDTAAAAEAAPTAKQSEQHADPSPGEGEGLRGTFRLELFEKVGRARQYVQLEEFRARVRLDRWAGWPGHQVEWDEKRVPEVAGIYTSKLTHAGQSAVLSVAADGTYTLEDQTTYVVDKAALSGTVLRARRLPPLPVHDPPNPDVYRLTVDEGRAGSSGLYRLADKQHRGQPFWRRYLGEDRPALVLLTDEKGRWALTSEDKVEDGRNYCVSAPHKGDPPHKCAVWGKLKGGELQPYPVEAAPLPPVTVGALVEARGLKGAVELNGRKGRVVACQGERWGVRFEEESIGKKALKGENLLVVERASPPARWKVWTSTGHSMSLLEPPPGAAHGKLNDLPFAPQLQPNMEMFKMLAMTARPKPGS